MGKNKQKKEPELTPEEQKLAKELENYLRSNGYLFPITPEQIRAFEALGIHHEMPAEFDNPEEIMKEILNKIEIDKKSK